MYIYDLIYPFLVPSNLLQFIHVKTLVTQIIQVYSINNHNKKHNNQPLELPWLNTEHCHAGLKICEPALDGQAVSPTAGGTIQL